MSLLADTGSFKVFLAGVSSEFKGSVQPKLKFWGAKQHCSILVHAHAFSLAAAVKILALKIVLITSFKINLDSRAFRKLELNCWTSFREFC